MNGLNGVHYYIPRSIIITIVCYPHDIYVTFSVHVVIHMTCFI